MSLKEILPEVIFRLASRTFSSIGSMKVERLAGQGPVASSKSLSLKCLDLILLMAFFKIASNFSFSFRYPLTTRFTLSQRTLDERKRITWCTKWFFPIDTSIGASSVEWTTLNVETQNDWQLSDGFFLQNIWTEWRALFQIMFHLVHQLWNDKRSMLEIRKDWHLSNGFLPASCLGLNWLSDAFVMTIGRQCSLWDASHQQCSNAGVQELCSNDREKLLEMNICL